MRNAPKWQRCQVFESLARTPLVEPTGARSPAKGRQDLEVDELRSHELLAT